ncbi:receptor-like protein kinase [Musa troglodytarum]|uniref:Receptor-like protein kinase n=1 Tax=Musa troglodytarum TaxID=320322 RepID=A0A9E7KQ20_9LILI|nr:receptor-like protein kinase [Musa troglodytarum]
MDFDAEGPSSGTINISIGRSFKSSPWDANAILNGLEIFKVNDTFGSLDGIPNHSLNSSRPKQSGVAVAAVVLAVVGGLVLPSLVLVFIRKRCRSKPLPLRLLPRYNLDLHIPLIDIKASTDGFDESLVVGSGGFGKVYKGVLADGTKVAVKRAMPGSKQGYPEFQTEILVLSKIRHRHLVSLIGYCEEQSERILVYEYMEKGPLRPYLYGSVKGTFGYFDPEYFKTQKLTVKSDVYSFGVMLFEVLCARAVIDRSLSTEQVNLAEWALQWQRKGQLEKIIDHRLVGNINRNSLRKFGETAEKCVADYGDDRPTFADVLWNLEYALQLHVTELKREPHEDSGNVELLIPAAATRGVESTSLNVKPEDDMAGTGMGQTDSTDSTVFSQLITSEGR